jgi:hypothetical protein
MGAGRPCLGCGAVSSGARCGACRAQQTAKYRGDWPEVSRRAIAAHVASYGWWCPGWRVEPHGSQDLTLDHQRGVMCRACNARKRNVDGE